MLRKKDIEKIFDTWPDPVLIISRNGKIIAANKHGKIYDPKLDLKSPNLKLSDITNLSQEEIDKLIDTCLRSKSPINVPLSFRYFNKNQTNIKMQVWPYETATGEQIIIMRTLSYTNLLKKFSMLGEAIENLNDEIKRHRDTEIKLRYALEEARAAMQSKDQFIRQISHEFRTPLNAVIGMSDLMMNHIFGSMEEHYESYAKDINYCGRTLLELIEEILHYKEGNRYSDSITDLNECLSNCLTIVESLAHNKGLELRLHNGHKLPLIRADQVLLKRILVNLITNAIKYTPTGGHVDVLPEIPQTGGVAITVSDDGIGIKPQDLEHVFEPFYRAEDVYVRKADGLGMGLALTKRAVEQIGGNITMKSDFGHGTQVIVHLPPDVCSSKAPVNQN